MKSVFVLLNLGFKWIHQQISNIYVESNKRENEKVTKS